MGGYEMVWGNYPDRAAATATSHPVFPNAQVHHHLAQQDAFHTTNGSHRGGAAGGGGGGSAPAVVVPVDEKRVVGLLRRKMATGKKAQSTPAGADADMLHASPSLSISSSSSRRRQQASSANLSAIELRRKRNRESMQRTRVRERAEVDKMRGELGDLEKQYKNAIRIQHTSSQRTTVAGTLSMLTDYYSLSSESKQIKRENFLLRQNLERRRKAYERTERILADYHLEKTEIDLEADRDDAIDSASAVFGIAPITEGAAFALISQCSQSVRRLEKVHASIPMDLESRCFGWKVQRKVIDDSNLHFLFTKTYPNLDPERASKRAWDTYKTRNQNHMKPIRVLRFETLQVVNENTHVIARDIVHPLHKGVVMRTIFLRFWMQTDTGFVVGRSCMNPRSESSQKPMSTDSDGGVRIRYADITTRLEINRLDPSNRHQVGCEVKFGGYCDYKTTHDLNERFMDVLFSVLQMENRVLEPLVPLVQECGNAQ